MNFIGKKLLIMADASLHKKVVEAAREMGIYTIVTDNIPNSPAKLIADKSYDINLSDVDGIVAMCKREKVDAVISVCIDFSQTYYQQVCDRLGLPCWGTEEQFRILTHKELFKKACISCGVDIIPSYSEQEIESKDDKSIYPVLVKPSQNRGSRGIAVCNNKAEALEAISNAKEISSDGIAVIEKYMGDKDDFQVTYLVVDGVPYVVRTADRYLGAKELGMDRVAIALSSPSKNTELYFNRVHSHMVDLLHSLRIENAPVFFQGFVDGETIRFYDPGLRFPGGDYDRIFTEVMGMNLMKSLIELAFTGKMSFQNKVLSEKTAYLNGKVIFTLHSTVKEGTISYETPVDELVAINGVKHATYRHAVGDTVGMTYNVNQRIAEVNILGDSIEDTVHIIHDVQKKLSVLDERGQDMIFYEFDANKLMESRNQMGSEGKKYAGD